MTSGQIVQEFLDGYVPARASRQTQMVAEILALNLSAPDLQVEIVKALQEADKLDYEVAKQNSKAARSTINPEDLT